VDNATRAIAAALSRTRPPSRPKLVALAAAAGFEANADTPRGALIIALKDQFREPISAYAVEEATRQAKAERIRYEENERIKTEAAAAELQRRGAVSPGQGSDSIVVTPIGGGSTAPGESIVISPVYLDAPAPNPSLVEMRPATLQAHRPQLPRGAVARVAVAEHVEPSAPLLYAVGGAPVRPSAPRGSVNLAARGAGDPEPAQPRNVGVGVDVDPRVACAVHLSAAAEHADRFAPALGAHIRTLITAPGA
jgi:hypothetical protein